MDAHQELLLQAQYPGCIMGNAAGEFIIVPLDREITPEVRADILRRGLAYCAVFGLVDGHAEVRCAESSFALQVVLSAHRACAQMLAERLRPSIGDSVDWLKNLHSLADPRTEMN